MIALLGTQPLVVNYHSGVLDGIAGRLGFTPPSMKEHTRSPAERMLRRFLQDLEHSINAEDSGKPMGWSLQGGLHTEWPQTSCKGTEARFTAYLVTTYFPTSSGIWTHSI